MELDRLEELLEKYDNAETSLQEEAELNTHFKTHDVPAYLESYRMLFGYFDVARTEQSQREVKPIKKLSNKFYISIGVSVAAVFVLLFSVYFKTEQTLTLADLNEEELLAYHTTIESLNFISSKFNQGASNLEVLFVASQQFEKGEVQFKKMTEFSKTTHKIVKNK